MLKDMNRIRNGLERISKAVEIQGTMEDSKKKKKDNTQELFYRINGLIEKFNSFIKNSDNIIYWLEEAGNKYRTKLCCIPKNLDVQLYNDIFQNKFPVILTSGTMSVDGDFNFLKSRLGMTKVRHRSINEISVKSPFDYESNCIIYIKDNMPYPDYKDKNYIDTITQEIGELIKATDGRTMVLFTSYRVLNTVYQGLAHMIAQYTFLKSARSDITIIDKFKGANKPVLFATGSCWEGIDIPGDALSSLIIVKLPFPVPDPILEYKLSLLQTEDEFRKEVLFPEMIIKLKQGFGRLIRKETDTGVVSILDSRLNARKSFRNEVLKCLPKCNVVNSIDSVQEFMKDRKDDSYFH